MSARCGRFTCLHSRPREGSECLGRDGAYTKFRGEHCACSDYLVNRILKGNGVSRAWSCRIGRNYSTREAALGGLDLEMGTLITGTEQGRDYKDYYLANPFLEGLRKASTHVRPGR